MKRDCRELDRIQQHIVSLTLFPYSKQAILKFLDVFSDNCKPLTLSTHLQKISKDIEKQGPKKDGVNFVEKEESILTWKNNQEDSWIAKTIWGQPLRSLLI